VVEAAVLLDEDHQVVDIGQLAVAPGSGEDLGQAGQQREGGGGAAQRQAAAEEAAAAELPLGVTHPAREDRSRPLGGAVKA